MSKIVIPIRGMHCHSCELLVEGEISKINGVKKARVDYKTGRAEVLYHERRPTAEEIEKAVETAGYHVGEKEKLLYFSRRREDYLNLLKAGVILFLLYLAGKGLGVFNASFNPSQEAGLGVALVVGLVAGVSTCMAIVGGLVLGLSARHAELHPEATAKEKFKPHWYFNLGRVAGFFILGGIAGWLGSVFKPSSNLLGLMTIVVGGVMIFLGLKLIEIFPILRDKTIALPAIIAKFFGINKEQREYSHKGAMILGVLTFFLPCGFTQAMQLFAVSTGSFGSGALIMSLFALGTSVGLLSIGGLSSVFRGQKAKIFFAGAGLAVILLGWFNIANGSRLISTGSAGNPIVSNSSEVQEVRMTQNSYGYSPNQFTIKKGVKVKWIINSVNPYSCASSIVMPKYGISKYLRQGENIIEFTPTEAGEIPFSCSMGMYRGKFVVR